MEIEVDILNDHPNAIQVNYEGRLLWLPKSQITEVTSIEIDPDGRESQTIEIPEWLAIEKGII